MVATGMSEGRGHGGRWYEIWGAEKQAATHAHTHACTRTHTPFRALSSARTQGRLQSQGRPVSSGMKPRTEPLKEKRNRKESWKEGKPQQRAQPSHGHWQADHLWLSGLGAPRGK